MGRTKHSEKFNPFSSVLRVTLSFVLMLAALATTPRANATAISNTEMDIGSVTVSVSSGSIVSVTASTALTNAGSAWLLMLSSPGGWSKGWQMPHAYIGEAGESGRKIISHRDFQPATGFNH